MEDYAETITAERVKRVINGYGVLTPTLSKGEGAETENKKGKGVEGTGGSFDYYTLGEPLFDENNNLKRNRWNRKNPRIRLVYRNSKSLIPLLRRGVRRTGWFF